MQCREIHKKHVNGRAILDLLRPSLSSLFGLGATCEAPFAIQRLARDGLEQ